jgi:preprotein translocase subunit SecG
MKLGLKKAAIVISCLFFILFIILICSRSKNKSCSEINEDFKICLDQKLIEYNLIGKEECNVKVYYELIDFCKKAVIEYP